MPPPSSGGISVQLMLNILEGHDLKAMRLGLGAEPASARRIDAPRVCRARAASRRSGLREDDADRPADFEGLRRAAAQDDQSDSGLEVVADDVHAGRRESQETTHFSIVDAQRNAVSMTYTLEAGYGSKIVAPGTGFLLEQRDGRLQRRARG